MNDLDAIPDIEKELKKYFGSLIVYYENKLAFKDSFNKSRRNILITNTFFLLTYLRQGWISLSQIDYLLFQPSKLPLGEENYVESIINEFYLPMMNMCWKQLPKMYIINTSTNEVGWLSNILECNKRRKTWRNPIRNRNKRPTIDFKPVNSYLPSILKVNIENFNTKYSNFYSGDALISLKF